MKKIFISSSILSADFSKLGKDIKKVVQAGSDWIHFDVMDNHYVPNLTFGPLILTSFKKSDIQVPIDVHIMAKPVDDLIIEFAKFGVEYITFHPESSDHVYRSIQLIKKYDCKVGIALNIATPLNYLDYIIDDIDLILLMSVNSGFAGQSFIYSVFNKIKQVKKMINKKKKKILLSVDGGIKVNNLTKVVSCGADVLVIGSAIFQCKNKNYKKIIDKIKIKINNL